MQSAVYTSAVDIIPPLTRDEQLVLARAILLDAQELFAGKAGATLAITDTNGSINARSAPVDIIAFRMRQYRATPVLFGYFIRRHDDGGAFWARVKAWYIAHYTDAARRVYAGV